MELRAEAFGTCEDATGQISGEAIPIRWDIIDGSDVVEKRNEIDPNGQVVGGLKEGFATIRATAIDKEDVFADVTVEVRDPTVEVEAKIGNCDWNAKFCYFPSIQPTDITVRVGLIENGVKVWKDNVMVSILPSVKGQVATPSFGFTDANGEFHSTISGIQDAQPYIIAMASAYFGVGQSKSVTVRGITTISCTGGSYGADSSINYGTPEGVVSHTLTKDVAQKYSYCSVSTSAIGPPIVAGHSGWSIVGVSVDTEWWDTIQVIPYNLDHLGQNIELIVDVDASVSGDYETRADYPGLVTSAGAGASVITYGLLEDSYTAWGCYGDSCYPEEGESTRSTILLGAGSLWNVGSPMGIGEFGLCSSASEASSYSDPNTSAFYTSYATSEAEVSVQWLSISDIISYPSGTSIGGYYIFSCSGEEYNISEPPW